jgi:formate dehydrogenase subunit gamma
MVELVKRVNGETYILRFKPITQVAHFFLFLGMILCFVTGLAMFFKIDEVQVFEGLGRALGLPAHPYEQLIGILHDWVGPILMLIGVIIALAASVRAETIRKALITAEDFRVFAAIVRSRLGRAPRPKVGFYHPLQKVWIWTVVVALLLLGISGAFLVYEKWFAVRVLDDATRQLMSILHIIGAFAFYVALPLHFIMAIAPINWPILKSQFLFRGYVALPWWKLHHPAYLDELERKGLLPPSSPSPQAPQARKGEGEGGGG